jgi:aspartyl-tRNA(Asn)/glutamyl-tRNA(Gln) amidotransferase subunit A
MAKDILSMTALELSDALQKRALKSVDIAAACLDAGRNQTSPVYIKLTEQRAMEEAKAADARLDAGQPLSELDGVPIAWKDLYDMEGEVTTAASILFEDASPATADAPVVAKAKAAGMVSIGKLNMTEMAYSGIGFNPHYGTPKNACSDDIHYSPGGSSSGSGAVIGRNMVPIAIGSDTGGSVRVPASYNGVVGLKTSEGRYDKNGVIPLSRTFDTVGPLAKTVDDCAAIDRIFRSEHHVQSPPLAEKPRFFAPQTIVMDDLDEQVAADYSRACDQISDAGYSIEPIDLDCFANAFSVMAECGTLVAMDAWLEYQDKLTDDIRARMDERVLDRMMRGADMSAQDVVRLHHVRVEGVAEIIQKTGSGFMLMPTTPIPAPELEPLMADKSLFHKVNLMTLRNTTLGNIFNLPGVAMPMNSARMNSAQMKDHRPTSLLVSTHAGRDDQLIEVARICEDILNRGES